jgi:hypothetical protein
VLVGILLRAALEVVVRQVRPARLALVHPVRLGGRWTGGTSEPGRG